MTSVQHPTIEDNKTIMLPCAASLAHDIGDLMWWDDSGNVQSRASLVSAVSEAADQATFASKFAGLADQARLASETTTGVNSERRVRQDCVVEMPCVSATWEIGDFVGASYNGGAALVNQVVTKVASANLAIGVCTRRGYAAETTVQFRLMGKTALDLLRSTGGVDEVSAYTQTYSTANRTVAAPTDTALTDNSTGSAGSTIAAGVGISQLSIPVTLAQITGTMDVVTALVMAAKFKILAFRAYVTKVVTTAAKAATLNIEIGSTDVTGGSLALTSANCGTLGAVIAASAITAANTGAAAGNISVEAASVTAFAEGEVLLVIDVQNMDTADAVASLAAKHELGLADDLDNRQTLTALIDDLQTRGIVG